ncbi:MAG: TolC family protein [Bacteriovoracaceae bacterium]|nr:TolC family protein [Bacteriovoracaceae bacterium]
MNLLLKKILPLTLLLTFSLGSYAKEVLSLQDLKEEVLAENLDIKIQYEKYYQAQRSVKNNLGEFLPNLSAQLFFWNTSYALLYAVSPNPTSWFNYRASQEMSLAEQYVTESIKLNILRDLSLSFISVKHQQELLASLKSEEAILAQAYEMAQNRERIGLGSAADTFYHSRNLMKHQQQIYMVETAMAIQKEGILMSINKSPKDDITLGELEKSVFVMPQTVEDAINMGVNNAPELTAHTFMAEGARHMVRGAKWSFLSFSGIGLGYPATLAIERSKTAEIELKKDQVENKIENQIALAYEQMDILDERIEIQKEIVFSAQESAQRAEDLHMGGAVDYNEVVKMKRIHFAETRNMISLKMEKEMNVAKLKRLLGLDATNNELNEVAFTAALDVNVYDSARRSKVVVDIDVEPALKEQIVSVTYSGDIFDYRIQNLNGNFSLYTKVNTSGEKLVKATLLLVTGEKVELETTINL